MVEVIGIDHVYLAVSDLARAEAFYDRLFAALGFRKNELAIGGERHVQYFNRHLGVVLRPARAGTSAHDPYAPGLHHLCLRVENADDVRRVVVELAAVGIEASEARLFPEYADDYVATFVTDPDGLRLEITNYRAERRRHDQWPSD